MSEKDLDSNSPKVRIKTPFKNKIKHEQIWAKGLSIDNVTF